MVVVIFSILWWFFSLWSDLDFTDGVTPLDDSFEPEKYWDKQAIRLYICYFILLIIAIFFTYFSDVDPASSNEDFENFKNLMKSEGLEWSDLFPRPKDKTNN